MDRIIYPTLKPKWASHIRGILVKFIDSYVGRKALMYKITADIDSDYTRLTQDTKDLLAGIALEEDLQAFLKLVDQASFMTCLYEFFKISDCSSVSGRFVKHVEKPYKDLLSYLDRDLKRYADSKTYAQKLKGIYQAYKSIFANIKEKAEERYALRVFHTVNRASLVSQAYEDAILSSDALFKTYPELKETFDFFLKSDKEAKTLTSHYESLAQNSLHAYVCQAAAIAHQAQTLLIHVETKHEVFNRKLLRIQTARSLLENPFVFELKAKYGSLLDSLNGLLMTIDESLSKLFQKWGTKEEDFVIQIDQRDKKLQKEQSTLSIEDKAALKQEKEALSLAIKRIHLHKRMENLFSLPSWRIFYYLCTFTEAAESLRCFFDNVSSEKMKLDKLPPDEERAYQQSLRRLKDAFGLCPDIADFFELTPQEFLLRLTEPHKKVRAFLTSMKLLDATIEDLCQHIAKDKTGEELPEKDRHLIALFKEMVASQPALISLSTAIILPRDNAKIDRQVQTFITYLRFKDSIGKLVSRFSPTLLSHSFAYMERALELSKSFRSKHEHILEEDEVFYPTDLQLTEVHELAKKSFFFLNQTKSSDEERRFFEYLILLILSGRGDLPCPSQVSLCPQSYKKFWKGITFSCQEGKQPYFLWHLENVTDKKELSFEQLRNQEVKQFFLDNVLRPFKFHFVVDGQTTIFDTSNPQVLPDIIAEVRKQLIRALTKEDVAHNAKRIQSLLKANASLDPLIPHTLSQEQFSRYLQYIASEVAEKGRLTDLVEKMSKASRFTEEELETLSKISGLSSLDLADLASKEVLKFMCVATQTSLGMLLTQRFLPLSEKKVCETIGQTFITSYERDLSKTFFSLDDSMALTISTDILFLARVLNQTILEVDGNFDLNGTRDPNMQAAYLVGFTSSLTIADLTLTHLFDPDLKHSYIAHYRPRCSADAIPLIKAIGNCFEENMLAQ